MLGELTDDEDILAYCELCCVAETSDHVMWKRLNIDDTLSTTSVSSNSALTRRTCSH